MKKNLLVSTLLIISIAVKAQTTLRLKPVNGAGKDAYIASAQPTVKAGDVDEFASLTWTCSGVLCVVRSLVQFDLSSVPASAIIDSAYLYLYAQTSNTWNGVLGQPTYGSDNAGWIQRITQPWTDTVVNWNNQPSTTTLNQVAIPQSGSTAQDYVLDVKTLVQDMVQNPSTSFGFLLRQQNETTWYNSLIFGSSDASDTSLAPMLIIKYKTGNTGCLDLKSATGFGKDAYIASAQPTVKAGDVDEFASLTWTCSSVLCVVRSLVQFDLSSVPANAIIDSAYLYLYAQTSNTWNGVLGQPTYGSDNAGWIQRITQPWTDTVVNWNNQPSTTTLNQVAIPQSSSTAQDYVLDVKSLVQDMVPNPSTSFGFLLRQQDETTWYNSLIFGSSDASDTSIHPRLKVCYTVPNGIYDIKNEKLVTVFPNPSNGQFTISASQFIQTGIIDIYNIFGIKVFSQHFNGKQATLNSQLSSGIYFVRLMDKENQYVQKIIIE